MSKIPALLLMSLILLTGCSDEKKFKVLPKESVILAFGDSLTYGYGTAALDESYPSRLESIIGYTVINGGLNGDSASNGKERIVDVVEESDPDVVILSLGGNDMLRKQDQNLEADLSDIVAYLKTRNIKVILLSEPKPSITLLNVTLKDADVYKVVADKFKIPLISGVFSNYLSDQKYKSDTIHLNALGYSEVAKDVAAKLVDFGMVEPK